MFKPKLGNIKAEECMHVQTNYTYEICRSNSILNCNPYYRSRYASPISLSTFKMTVVKHTQLDFLQAYHHNVPVCISNASCLFFKTK